MEKQENTGNTGNAGNIENARKQTDGKALKSAQSGKTPKPIDAQTTKPTVVQAAKQINGQTAKTINAQTPKPISAFGSDELAEAVFFFAGALDEIVDTVFLAGSDPEFLTTERIRELQTLQTMAQLIAERAAMQILNNMPSALQTANSNNAGCAL